MKKMKMRALLTSLLLLPAAFFAQYDGLFTQYMFNEVFINPAYAGSKEAMSATLLNRQQWVSFPGRPVTTSMSLHGPLKDGKMGAGLSILNEKIGVLNRNLIYGTYAYRLKLDEKSTLAMGLMAGIDNQLNRLGQVKASSDGSPADPQFTQNTPNVFAPNAGAGVYYNNEQFYAGLSVPRLIDNAVRFSPSGATIKTTRVSPSKFTYYFTGGYLFRLQEDLKMRANVMIKAVKNAPAQFDLGANFLIRDMIWAGMSYRSASAVSALLGAQVNKQFFVCYSYDYSTSKIQNYSQGSHEIVLNYLFSFSGKKVVTPRYF
jgi:type IX secretion system PorP/SprF family membrane protein